MRILLFSNSYPPALGGLQTVAHQLATGLAGRGHAVRVLANRYPLSLPARERMDGIPVQRDLFLVPSADELRRFRPDLFLVYGFFYLVALLQLTALMRSFRPDVVNIHYPLRQTPFVLWLKRRYRFRLVVSLHGGEVLPFAMQGTDQERLRELLRQADAVTACSRWLMEQTEVWEPQVRGKGVVIHNGIAPERFDGGGRYLHPRPYLFAYGRFTFHKGFDLLLEAFAETIKQYPEVDLVLAGEGDEQKALLAQARALGCDDRVHFWGRATPGEVVQLLNGCRFVVVPSRWEPFGIVALEALAAGKPVLATRVGGMTEFLNGSSSKFVGPTVEDLTGGMKEWLGLASLPQPDRHAVHAKFKWGTVVKNYENVLLGSSC